MSKARKVFQIRTSEDGTVAIVTNKKLVMRALKELKETYPGQKLFIDMEKNPAPTYANVSEHLRRFKFADIYCDGGAEIHIEEFRVNQVFSIV